MLKSYLIVLSSKKGLYNLYFVAYLFYHKKALLPKYHMKLSYGNYHMELSQLQNYLNYKILRIINCFVR